MCDFENRIKFCSCDKESIKFRKPKKFIRKKGKLVEQINPKDSKIPLEYIWTLFKFDGEKEITEIGRYMMPINDLGNGLNAEWIALNLNCEDCFDFEYTPSEGDNLKIHENVIMSAYLSFIYRNGEWIIDHHSPWSTEISKLKEGKIKTLHNKV
ncbi:hypothetical protein [Aquimarina latercula]|uniref:hypothetical protein n=1 Tax=Aquimarina latercula TaxID=987 RepID=UPI00040EF833|nr:hypothetical protein [Aquimarina latercula]